VCDTQCGAECGLAFMPMEPPGIAVDAQGLSQMSAVRLK